MKDWKTLQPDQVRLMNKHYTPGRGGQKISPRKANNLWPPASALGAIFMRGERSAWTLKH